MFFVALFYYVYDRAFIYQLLVTLFVYCIFELIRLIRVRVKRFKIFKEYGIPTPEISLIDGHFRSFTKDKRRFLIHQELTAKYGLTYGYYFGDIPMLHTTDTDILKKVFLEDYGTFGDRTYAYIDIMMSYGILFCQRVRWKFFRKAMAPPFNKLHMRGNSSTQFIEESVALMTGYLENKLNEAEKLKKPADFDIYDLMKAMSLHMICRLALNLPDVKVEEKEPHVKGLDDFIHAVEGDVMTSVITIPTIKPVLSFLANYAQYFSIMSLIYRGLNLRIDSTMKKFSLADKQGRSISEEQSDILDLLIRMYYEKKMTLEELFGNAETLLFAGYDTTSTTLTYTLWCLAKHTDVQTRLREDLKVHGIESKYVTQVLDESMRLYPVVASFVTRVCLKTTKVKDIVIPEGTIVIYDTYEMHHDPRFWKDPQKFDPDRFKEGVEIPTLAFAPFGLGERKCLGYKLAMLEMKIVLCELLLRYELRLKSPQDLVLKDFSLALTRPKEKVSIEFKRLH